MKNNYFRLYASCIPVSGALKQVICDLQRGTIQPIPESLYLLLTEFAEQTIEEIKAFFDHQQDDQIDSYYAFLEAEDWGFWCSDPSHFPPIDLTWKTPSIITNAIIDIDDTSDHPYEKIFASLQALGCEALQIRSYSELSLPQLEDILQLIGDHRLKAIQLIIPYQNDYSEEAIRTLCRRYPRIATLTLHTAPTYLEIQDDHEVQIIHTPQVIDDSSHCGWVTPAFFTSSLSFFTEAQEHNSCLNRKLSIDRAGYVKNCPSMDHHYGHIQDLKLEEVLADESFRSWWTISKDQIEVCRDCEYRYVCTDCRAFTERGGINTKPLKCKYNPYTGIWED